MEDDRSEIEIDREQISELLSHCHDPRGVITESFGDQMFDLAQRIGAERTSQAVRPYTVDDLRFLLHMGVLTATAHFGQTRQTGEGTWESHLLGTDKNLITELGRTRVPVLAAGLGHDLKEDTLIKTVDQFRHAWMATFRERFDPLLPQSEPILRRTWDLIRSATKTKGDTREETSASYTRKLLGATRGLGLDIVHLKAGGDRLDNMRTIGVKSEPVRQDIARETYEVYCRMGDIIGIRRYVRTCVDLCAGVLHPELLAHFEELRDQRIREGLDMRRFLLDTEDRIVSVREYVDSLFDPKVLPNIMRVEYVPASLADFVVSHDEPLEQLQLSDFGISTLSPLFEVVVLVKPGADIHAILNYLIRHCAEPGDRRKTEEANHTELPKLGTRLTIHSRKLGILIFRINDTVTEARSKRGALPIQSLSPASIDPVSDEMRAAIRRILRETQGDRVTRTIPLARELLLRPSITIYTPHGDPKNLPKGATPIDFAASVHPDFVDGFDEIIHHESEAKHRSVNPFDPLEDGMQIEIVRGEKFSVDPGWLLFCETEQARSALRKILNHGSPKDYVRKIASLFGLHERRVLETIRGDTADETLSQSVGIGNIEPLSLLGETFFKDRKVWKIRVELPDEPGILRAFLGEFDRQGINVNRFLHIPEPPPAPHVIRMEIEDFTGAKSPFDMMKILLKLSYANRVSVLPHNPIRRAGQRVMDFLRVMRNTLGSPFSL